MSQKKIALWVLGILIIATFLRTNQLSSLPPGLYPDEAMNGNNALEALRTSPPNGGFKLYYPENNGREGLFINIQALFLKYLVPMNGGLPEPWMLRLPSTVFGTLTVLGLFFLGKALFSPVHGLLASFFLATNFWHMNFSRIGFRAIMAPFLMVWASVFIAEALKNTDWQRNKRLLIASTGGLIFGLGFHTYIAYRIMPLAILVLFFFFRKTKDFYKIFCFFVVAAIISASPMFFYYSSHPEDFLGRTSQISVFSSGSPIRDLSLNILKTIGMFNVVGDFNTRHNYPGRPQLFWPVGICFLIGIWISLKHLPRILSERKDKGSKGTHSFWFTFAWFALAALPVVISNEGLPHALRAILMIPPTFLLAAVGAEYVLRFSDKVIKPRRVRKASMAILVMLLVAEAYSTYFIKWGNFPDTKPAFAHGYVKLAKDLNSIPNQTPKYVVVRAGGVSVRGVPMPTQTTMFLTDTFMPSEQKKKNLYYLLPGEEAEVKNGLIFYLE